MSSLIFGPVHSRRFGKSLGVDLSPGIKQCNFDCLYCELAPAKTVDRYTHVVPVDTIVAEIKEALSRHTDIDVLTITANGEPTLYPHLLELMEAIDRIKGATQTLILSNAATIDEEATQEALMHFDMVKLSLDCATAQCLKRLDRTHNGIDIERIKEGMLRFRARYKKPLFVEILIVPGINDKAEEIDALNNYLCTLRPDRIDLGSVDRPPAYAVQPVSYAHLRKIAESFDASLPVVITARRQEEMKPESYSEAQIVETLCRRPLTHEDIEVLFDAPSRERLQKLLRRGLVYKSEIAGTIFYRSGTKNS